MTLSLFLKTLLNERQVGRLNRRNYLWGTLAVSLAFGVLFVLISMVRGTPPGDFGSDRLMSLLLVLTYPFFVALTAGRLNDIGMNGWWALLTLGNLLRPTLEGHPLFEIYFWAQYLLYLIPGKKTPLTAQDEAQPAKAAADLDR